MTDSTIEETVTLKVTDVYQVSDRTYMTLEAPSKETVVWFKDVFEVVEEPSIQVRIGGTLELRAFDDRRANVVDVLPILSYKTGAPKKGAAPNILNLVNYTLRRTSPVPTSPLAVKILPNKYNMASIGS